MLKDVPKGVGEADVDEDPGSAGWTSQRDIEDGTGVVVTFCDRGFYVVGFAGVKGSWVAESVFSFWLTLF